MPDARHASHRGSGVFRPPEAMDVVLLGDILDFLRSSAWPERSSPGERVPRPWEPDESATATINYTSGTTARPKGVQLTHRNLWLNVGHGGLGFTFACGSARILADLMRGKAPPIALDGLTLR